MQFARRVGEGRADVTRCALAGATEHALAARRARRVVRPGGWRRTSLKALSLHTGVFPFHLVRVFTRAVGLSPHQYLVQTRIRHATRLLAQGVPCSFVAAMTGFADQSHLTTQFKRHLSITPASYQRCLRAD
ncbi:MAG TPA: helix-turn-helix transcriptional regulator [Gemmatimonadaceae bacterium]